MHLTEIPDSEVRLRLPGIDADGVIDPGIPAPLPRTSFAMLVTGTPGSGKSSLAVSLITAKGMARVYRKSFNHLYIVCPPHSLHSYRDDPFGGHNRSKMFDDLDHDTLAHIEGRLEKSSLKDETSLIFIDDCAVALKDRYIQRSLNRIMANRRHLKASLIIVAQSYRMIPLTTRKLCSHLLMFRPSNAKERDAIHEEMMSHIDKDDFLKIYKYAYVDKHDHLLVEASSGKLWRNFNTLQIDE